MQDKVKVPKTQEAMLASLAGAAQELDPAVDTYVRESSLVLRVRAAIRKVLGTVVVNLKIIATGGVVELYGELDSEAEIEATLAAARTVPGAQIVVSNLNLKR